VKKYVGGEDVKHIVNGYKMKQKLESIVKKGKMFALAGLMYLTMGCASSKFYIEPKVGVMVPGAAKEQAYEPSATIGGACGLSGKVIGIEAGLDYFNSSGEYLETNHILSNVNLNLNLSKPESDIKFYLTGGMSFLNESSTIDIPKFNVHDEMKNTTLGFGGGFGIDIVGFNTRITYTGMPESENVNGMVHLTLGYSILFGKKSKKFLKDTY